MTVLVRLGPQKGYKIPKSVHILGPMRKTGRRPPGIKDQWEHQAANELKAQIKRAGLAYADLAEKLSAQDAPTSAHGLAKKLHRGAFSYAFFLRCKDILEAVQRENRPPLLGGPDVKPKAFGGEDVRDLPVRPG